MKKKKLIPIIVILLAVIILVATIVYFSSASSREKTKFISENIAGMKEIGTSEEDIEKMKVYLDENYDTIKAGIDKKEADEKNAKKAKENAKPANPELVVEENKLPEVKLKIKGMNEMVFELYPNEAPESVYNFIYLIENGFYDGLSFHRMVTDFVAQGGDPLGTGMGGPGYGIKGEFLSNGVLNELGHSKGSLAFARGSEMDSAGSQFYITLVDMAKDANYSYMDEDYAVFGKIISGIETVDKLNKLEVDEQGTVKNGPVTIESISVDTKGIDYPEPNKLNIDEEIQNKLGLE